MTRRHHTTDSSLRMQSFVFPMQSVHDGQPQAAMNAMQMSPEQHQHQMMYDQINAINHSPIHTQGPWQQQGFPPQAFIMGQTTHHPVSQPHSHSQPVQLPSSSSSTSLQSVSSTSTSASARPRTRSQTKRDAQAAAAATSIQEGTQMLPPPVPPLPEHVAPAPVIPAPGNGTTSNSSAMSVQSKRSSRTPVDAVSSLPRSISDPIGLGLQGVKTRQRAKREAEYKPPPLSVNVDRSPGQLVFPGTLPAEGSPHAAINSANQSPIAFAHPSHPAWGHLSYTPTTSRTMTPTSTTPSLHSSAYSTSSLSPPSLTSNGNSSGSSSRRPPKRKAKLTNHLRKEMLEFADKYPKMTQTDIGIRFEVERSTVSKTLKNRHAIMRELEDGRMGPKNRPTKYPDVEEQMTPWVARLTEQNKQITDAMIREKALQVAESLGHTPRFKASVGWVSGFKNRHHIRKGVVGGAPTEDECMDEEEEPPTTSKRRRMEKSAARQTTGEVTEEETEREEESSTMANSSQFSSGFSAQSSSSITTFDTTFDEYAATEDHDMIAKVEPQPDTAAGMGMLLEEPASTIQQVPSQRQRAHSNSSAPTNSPVHIDGFVSPTGSHEFQGQLAFPQAGSQSLSNDSSPVQSTLRAEGFLFPALAEEPSAPEQPGTPSTQLSNMVLFTPPQQGPRSSSSRNTLHAYVPSTDTIMEDDEPAHAEISEAAYQNAYGQLGTPFILTSSAPHTMGNGYEAALSGFSAMHGQMTQTHSQPSLAMTAQSTSARGGPPPLHHAMSEMAVPQATGLHRSNRLQRSRSQSEVLFSSRAMYSDHGPPTDFRISEMTEQLPRAEYAAQGGSNQPGAYMSSNTATSTDPAAKLAWLDHTINQVMGDLSEDELRMFSQVRERVQRQQANDLMAGQNA
ncbi:hypothetical protein CALVIDRAFT_566329 [Calocera viscosa TUFC12733]|uniref:HTH CENPB-type domain-containing protein n=1 Tax=Calocera viscosa (strain TUFC12733) TaxID=1330018 RepID=A0A167JHB1_CALVF|nr:hypothetical protein CALVIDRAFT_566329 [Calocera viscosa TUFC12733]